MKVEDIVCSTGQQSLYTSIPFVGSPTIFQSFRQRLDVKDNDAHPSGHQTLHDNLANTAASTRHHRNLLGPVPASLVVTDTPSVRSHPVEPVVRLADDPKSEKKLYSENGARGKDERPETTQKTIYRKLNRAWCSAQDPEQRPGKVRARDRDTHYLSGECRSEECPELRCRGSWRTSRYKWVAWGTPLMQEDLETFWANLARLADRMTPASEPKLLATAFLLCLSAVVASFRMVQNVETPLSVHSIPSD